MTKGFTLIELSIVIIIIGLLVAGVLAGREIIQQANIQSTIKDIRKIDTAITTFTDKFRAFPGNLRTAYAFFGSACGTNNTPNTGLQGGCNGDDDDCLDATQSVCSNTNLYFQNDIRLLFMHLNVSKIYEITPAIKSATTSTDCSDGALFPPTAAGGGYLISGRAPGKLYMYFHSSANYVHNGTQCSANAADGGSLTPSLTPEILASIDSKLDDGKGRTGRIQSIMNYQTNAYIGAACDDSSGNYALTTTTATCSMRYELR